jgi:broad-specificity NMP kinase
MDSIQEKALKMALSGQNLSITGYPGAGKSFTVAHITGARGTDHPLFSNFLFTNFLYFFISFSLF